MSHLNMEGSLMDGFLKAVAQRFVNFHGTANNLAGDFGVKVLFFDHFVLNFDLFD
jgi:hypothetical protein